MFRHQAIRRGVSALALVALLTPAPLLAQTSPLPGGAQQNSLVGAFMGMACGAGINLSRRDPLPIVAAVTAFACVLMMMDAAFSADH